MKQEAASRRGGSNGRRAYEADGPQGDGWFALLRGALVGTQVVRVVLILIALVGAFTSVVVWAFASPVGAAPDEDFHLTSIWCVEPGEGSACPTMYLASGTPMVLSYSAFTEPCFAHRAAVSAGCQKIDISKSFTFRVNNGGYPAAYYRFFHLFASDSLVSPEALVSSVLMIRVMNAMIYAVLLAAVYALSSRHVRSVVLLTLLTTLVPVGLFMIASVNPSSWAIGGVAVQLFAGLGFALASGWRRVALGTLTLFGAVLAACSRGDAGAYSVVVALVLGWQTLPLWWRDRKRTGLIFLASALPGVVSFLTSGQTRGVGSADLATTNWISNLLDIGRLPLGNLGYGTLGDLGWLDTAMPAATWGVVGLSFGFVVVGGLVTLPKRAAVAVAGVLALLVGIPYYMLQRSGYVVGEYLQPRYILPLQIVLVGLLLFRTSPVDQKRAAIRGEFVVGVAAFIANAAALYANLLRYTNGSSSDILGDRLEWWWSSFMSPWVLWSLGAVAPLLMVVGLVGTNALQRAEDGTLPSRGIVEQ